MSIERPLAMDRCDVCGSAFRDDEDFVARGAGWCPFHNGPAHPAAVD